jgi:phage-related protein
MPFPVWNPPVKPRINGTSLKLEQRVLTASFGDGYEQTAEDGLNPTRETWTLAWPAIANAHADEIEDFWRSQGMSKAFWYRVPGRTTTKRYKFTSFDRSWVSGRMDGVTTGIRESFDIED